MTGSNRRKLRLAAVLGVLALALPLAITVNAGVIASASVTVVKVTLPASDPQDFAYSGTGPGIDNGFDLDTDSGDGTNPSERLFQFGPEQLGANGILENAATGWVLLDVECTGDDDVSIVGAQVNLNVESGESIICTFTNGKLPLVTLTKATVPASDPQDFYLEIVGDVNTTLDTDPASVGVPSSETFSFAGADLGERTIEETAVAGWTLTGILCTGDEGYQVDLEDGQAFIDIDEDENIACTFTNTKDVEESVAPSPEASQADTDTSQTTPEPASSPFTVGVLIVALVLLSGVLLLTRPKRSGK